MTMTGTPPRITNASSVVDLQAGRQCADNESLPLDTDGTNDTTSQAECLLTRETSLSASRLELSADLHQRLDVFESASMCESVANDTTEAGEQATMPGTLHECDRFSFSGRLPCTVEDDDFAMSYCV
ncbi:hypothetical protein BaRGS_00023042 [Batillaria attramentaria]|uniref:Uncharacterized protein n=1 Tax=Batillaria attramentaria TaxID=370345 RepID=A0ABD0KF01_9CAEN